MDVIFASGNAGKVSEMQQLLAPVGLQLKSLKDFGLSGAEETATTFVENALIKARAAAHSAQLPAIADDSGLVVRALNGEPGVYSARYAGEDGNDAANNTKLLATAFEPGRSARLLLLLPGIFTTPKRSNTKDCLWSMAWRNPSATPGRWRFWL